MSGLQLGGGITPFGFPSINIFKGVEGGGYYWHAAQVVDYSARVFKEYYIYSSSRTVEQTYLSVATYCNT